MRLKQKYLPVFVAIFASFLLYGCAAEIIQETEPSAAHAQEEQNLQTVPAFQEPTHTAPEETESASPEMPEEQCILKNPWYTTERLIYHACGGIDGISYTNSREAMESTLAAGNMFIEVDFLYTTDGHLVCLHNWTDMLPRWKYKDLKRKYKDKEDQIPETKYTLDQFLDKKVKDNFSGLTAADIVSYMKEYPELYIIVDTKEENPVAVIADLLKLCDFQADIADRFIIQLYDRGQREKILELYPFPRENFLFTCYKFDPLRVDEILELCREEQIRVVTVSHGIWEAETVNLFLKQGVTVFEHTVNLPEQVELSLEKGIHGFYTDFLQISQLNDIIYQKMEQ